MKELLNKLEIEEEIKDKILKGMEKEGIYTTAEENIDIRYSKLKQEKEELEKELSTATETLEELKSSTQGKEELKEALEEYENKVAELEEARKQERIEFQLKSKLKDAGAKDTDYLIYKLGGLDKLELDEEGNVKELDNLVKDLQSKHEPLFGIEEEPEVIPNPLPEEGEEAEAIASEFAEALKGN